MIDIPKDKKIILTDGVCNLCNGIVLKIIKYDMRNTFLFANLQSEAGKELTKYLGIDTKKIDAIILYEPGVSYEIKSNAALKIMDDFGGFWKLTFVLRVFPVSFRDVIYDIIAKNRYKWFGKKESCMMPTPEMKAKFLS
ncbi:MAG: DCC1-like thiol-disulfide oxidoreductase family protein [Polaribacter sp.]|jgi:predicted DCC family thiol-disulfide oxidoreductase YuxK|nr:DCC1-like thiol-disulfide oxidoreductase family protein [Polaribacter sp.]MDP4704248.1 DCC1-like thiol-disulfide oxidoreductase family protein [Polaribacter sp.]MDP4988759.1 DCC1-like thiol-disulfide oxidoreductase family protein [Polaribacter sp.]